MSLVEQTIARLKKQQTKSAGVGTSNQPSRRTAPGLTVDPLDDSASSAEQITVDSAALRAGGYLPEPEKEREFADQYRRIKRPLIDRALSGDAGARDPRIIVVTSALPGDGKTFTSVNLALSMSLERDISVLLIDTDVAKRRVGQIFAIDQRRGLLDVLVNDNMDAESLIVPTTTRGLSILPAGTRVPNTEELLSSNRMRKIMTSLSARNPRRILLLDSPPLLVTNEGRALVKIAGQIVLVVRAGETPRQAVQTAITLFDTEQAGGVVLNQVPGSPTDGYYGYGSYGTDGAQT